MGDVFNLLDHINEEPPAYRILAWRYLKPKPSRARNGKPEPVKQSDVKELVSALGVAPQPVPQNVRDSFNWAQAELARRNSTKKK